MMADVACQGHKSSLFRDAFTGVPGGNPVSLTLNEAGYVVEQSNTAINRAVDRGVIKGKLQRCGKKTRLRKIGPAELRFLAILREVERKLTLAGRRQVYEAMRLLSTHAPRLEIGVMSFQLLDVDRRITERLKRLHEIKTLVDEEANAEPVLSEINVPVYEIEALTRGQTIAELLEDYSGLTSAQVEAAICRCLQSLAVVLANRAASCSDYLPMVLASCSDCAPLCFPTERRARQQRVLLTLGANEQNILKHKKISRSRYA